jgi:hypothetical protein
MVDKEVPGPVGVVCGRGHEPPDLGEEPGLRIHDQSADGAVEAAVQMKLRQVVVQHD